MNATDRLNVHSIAIQVPISHLTLPGRPTIGVWASSRQAVMVGSMMTTTRRLSGWPLGVFGANGSASP
jgi:Domain of unknown function (DUF4331)